MSERARSMNRKVLLVSTALMAAMMLSVAIVPVLAAPIPAATIVVTVKDSTGKPVEGATVYLSDKGVLFYESYSSTDSKGVISCALSGTSLTRLLGQKLEVRVGDSTSPVLGTVTENKNFSGKITVRMP